MRNSNFRPAKQARDSRSNQSYSDWHDSHTEEVTTHISAVPKTHEEKGDEAKSKTEDHQKVLMSKDELARYVKEGRPTGFLLKSVAVLKGMSIDVVASASGYPSALVSSLFADSGAGSIKKGAIKKIAAVLGIDLSTMKFASGRVHVFDLKNIPGLFINAEGRKMIRAIGLLTRGASVAELEVGKGIKARAQKNRLHVMQSGELRAMWIGTMTKRFDIAWIPSAQWVRQRQQDSIVCINRPDVIKSLKTCDLTEFEFDEMFMGSKALSWDDIRVASRVNGVSKADIMSYIESRMKEIDAVEDATAKRDAVEDKPILRLVDSERIAVGQN